MQLVAEPVRLASMLPKSALPYTGKALPEKIPTVLSDMVSDA